MLRRDDLLAPGAPDGTEVWQLTTESPPSSHVYMEAQIFTPDSGRFVLHRSAHAHGSDKDDPGHCYLLCDLSNSGELVPITHELGATGPSISPDGAFLYYFVNRTKLGGGRLILKRVRLDGSERCEIACVDGPVGGTPAAPSRVYPLSTISSDGRRVAISAFFGDGETESAPFGLMVFEVASGAVDVVLSGPSWCNLHPQYCRSTDPEASRDILVQENHGSVFDAAGEVTALTGGEGADIHVVRDDGSAFRTMPWGRNGDEACQGHQCWRGRMTWGITSTSTRSVREEQLIEGVPCGDVGHRGLASPGAVRNDLSRSFPGPHFFHFATDAEGNRLITDHRAPESGAPVVLFDLGEPGREPLLRPRFLARTGSSWDKTCHVHPFLSPDGRTGFFNSDESGVLQAYMVRGF